ncbi:PASTA domain-containing protein [Nakamurella sp. GG22]
MSSTFSDFSGRQNLPVDRYVRPRNLNELCAAVQSVSAGGRAGHAMGTGWAMSAPAYSPDTVIRTDLLRGFPTTLQNAIVDPEPSAGTVLVAVEAGIRIRDLYLALSADSPWKPVIDAVLSPATQQLGAPTALVVTVRDDVGQPLSGATVQITNYPNEKLVQQTDVSGVATFNVTFRMQRNFDPETRQWEDEQPTGRVSANGFKGSDLPLVFEEPVPPAIDTAPLALRSTLSRGRDLEMMTMGGVGAQSLCGATSTGTHGSDVARPPIGDYIRAMVVVGSGGVVRLLQRDGSPPVVDFARLKAELAATLPGAAIEDATGTETFNAALLAMGRFGVVYACVLEVHDASDQFTYQHRSWSTWNDVKANLVAVVERARLADQFLQIVVNPVRPPDGNRRCYITRQAQLPRSRAATAGAEFESNTLTDNPAGDPVAFTTEFPGQGLCMRVVYRGTDGRLHEIASTDPGGGVFGHADLTLLAGAPLAAGDPVAFTTEFPGQGLCMRVVYRGTDGRLHEIASTDPGGGVFGHADLTLLAGAPLAAGDPVAFTTEFPGQGLCMRVVYRGTDGRLHEIASTDPGGGVFGHADLTLLAGAPLAAGDPVAFTTEFPGQGLCMRVVYRGTDGRLHEIASTDPGGGVFGHADLTLLAGAPLAAGDPVAFTTEFPGQGLCMRVVYRGTDGRLHEIASTDPGGGVFGHADLTLLAGAPLAAGDPVAFTTEFPGQGLCMRVVYRGTDGRLHEIASTDPGGGVFGHADLTLLAGAPLAAGDPVAFTTEFPGQGLCMRVVYRGTDGRLHEIASTDPGGGVFGHADLTLLAGIQPPQASMSLAEHQRLPEPSIPIPSEWRAVADTVAHLGRHFGAGLGPAPTGSGLCSPTMTSELNELRHTLSIVGMAPVPGSNMFRAAADSLGRISGAHKLGDVVADALSVGPPQIVDQIISGVFDVNQRPRLVHGRRWEVSDNYDYNNDCYRGDAVELFFPVDDRLADKARLVFEVFDTLRSRGTPLAAWISLRFMTPSQATLATAAFEPVTCAIEVSMLRGIAANTWALAALHDVARNHGGLVHWGLRNDLTAAEVTTMFGDRHRTWSQALAAMEGTSTTFSNPFSRNHGLEPPPGQTLPAERTQVPDVHGMSRAEARAAVRSALLKPQFTGSGTWAASQTPDPDTDVEVGSTVTCRFTGSQPN